MIARKKFVRTIDLYLRKNTPPWMDGWMDRWCIDMTLFSTRFLFPS